MANEAPIPNKILLFGATGLIGEYILQALIEAKPKFEKLGIFTSPRTAKDKADAIEKLKAQGVDVVVGDVTNEDDVKQTYQDYDTIISALGRGAIPLQIPLLTLAESTPNIHTFYPSEYGTDIEYSPTTSPHEPPHQFKLKVRAHIRDNIHRLKITYLVTGPYSDLYIGKLPNAPDAGTWDIANKTATLLGTGDEKVSFTTMHDVGVLLVAALRTPTSSQVRTLKVNSFTATPHQILTEYEKQTGAKWDVSYTSLDALRAAERKAWEEGKLTATAYTLRRIWTEGGTLYEERDNGRVGEPGVETLEEQVGAAVGRERGDGKL
ncbi:NAD(P)-binding protein [Polyplosphaeria fusca]|uniref:NAD(P)-binding protein n=1 Tax=Polyplosphaeria fusca TaxID=682080 RepID=A0A9P4QWH6_9PLEO|nr:NAD(P)-binding protein [Polyplosphaeria fusca]